MLEYHNALSTSYALPTNSKESKKLAELHGAAVALTVADIAERHDGLLLLVCADMQTALRLHAEVPQFTALPILSLADWETLPYDSFSPHQAIISQRLATLYQLPQQRQGIVIVAANTLMQRCCPAQFLHSQALMVKKGQTVTRELLRENLQQAGYRAVSQVMEPGEFAIRGELFDLFPMGSSTPYRFDFFDNEIESLRTFDIESQLTLTEVAAINLLPAHEFPTDQSAIDCFRRQWRERFDVRRESEHLYQQVSKGILPAGIEYWQPLFFDQPLASLFDYFPPQTLVISAGDLLQSSQHYWHDIEQRYQNRRVDPMRPLLEPSSLWLTPQQFMQQLQALPRIALQTERVSRKAGNHNLGYQPLADLTVQAKHKTPLHKLQHFLQQQSPQSRVIFSVISAGRKETLADLLKQIHIWPQTINQLKQAEQPGYYLLIGACEKGFCQPEQQLIFICEADLLGERVTVRSQQARHSVNPDLLIRNLAELKISQPVVHLEHGVGRYAGLTTLAAGGITAEYLVIHYANEAKLYVPVNALHLINRYAGGAEENAPLHKLGSDAWSKARSKAAEKIRDVAAELLDIYAKRAAKPGFAFALPKQEYQQFCQQFPFETTVDQQQAIDAVIDDMQQPHAMDRLVCGDVGFGKTEVAMRAAFLAVMNNKQVALLVPTTLLAEQHADNFRDRFADWPIKIEALSRFRSSKAQSDILAQLQQGKIDIVIGTHKLLQKDIHWQDLGLLIVDEEHRFGVRHKEQIKALRADVDILTLTATPIPRTLNMAMSGMRDLSIIATPPAKRMAIKTFVRQYDSAVIREAILREILRGGQAYYLFNDVAKIDDACQRLQQLIPEARFVIGHGQMRERDLERVMNDFHHQRFNVLVCSTIIETGIDIPNANTIIIERADQFGLAQLHQLRGRVGRSHHQAYAYLLTPPPKTLSTDAQKRLEAIASLEDLGAGFVLATHDLEIRGAGELLGEEQSGQMQTLGFELYMDMLSQAVELLKAGHTLTDDWLSTTKTEIELRIPALFPEEYIADVNNRLSLYKRLASCQDDQQIIDFKIELIDRFGRLPDAALNLLTLAQLRLQADKLGIKRLEASTKGGIIELASNHAIDQHYLLQLLQQESTIYHLDGPTRLKFVTELAEHQQRLAFVVELLTQLQQHSTNV